MTNWEKYKDEIVKLNLDALELKKYLMSKGFNWTGNQFLNIVNFKFWCDEEYNEREIDWTKVPKFTQVMVKDKNDDEYVNRYFIELKDDLFLATIEGEWTYIDGDYSEWDMCKFPDSFMIPECWLKENGKTEWIGLSEYELEDMFR